MVSIQDETYQAMEERLEFTYQHENLHKLYAKTTVSELKMKAMEEKDEAAYELFEHTPLTPYIPDFIEEKGDISGVMRGNAYHRIMELMDFTNTPDLLTLWNRMEKLQEEKILDETYLSLVRKDKLELFLASGLAQRMKKAALRGSLYRERPFVLGIPASMLKEHFPKEETVLIQGIIDAYFEEEGELVVVDYKTDKVSYERELMNRYADQLEHYANALTKITGKTVKEKIIYSFSLNKEIML